MEENNIFAQRLKELREKREWSQAELARNTSITPAAINQFEKGSRKPNLPILQKIAQTLEVSIDYLVGESNKEEDFKVQKNGRSFIEILVV